MERIKKSLYKIILIIALFSVVLNSSSVSFLLFFPRVNAQLPKENNSYLPVLLIHGYLSDALVWKKWEDLLKKDGIQFQSIAFKSDDKCGTAADHAKELSNIIEDFKRRTGANQVNIVGHSKGGLDARVYLENIMISDSNVANLIMIGTPNAGSPLANTNDICFPAIEDLRPGAADTKAIRNPNTNYYTIAGDWNPSLFVNCTQKEWLPAEITGYFALKGREGNNDGIVPISSVESQGYFINLGHTSNCHSNLLGDKEYKLAQKILHK
jgi:triacylglycerol esterase/lipase EstA (alpha/beta hydrolase family)